MPSETPSQYRDSSEITAKRLEKKSLHKVRKRLTDYVEKHTCERCHGSYHVGVVGVVVGEWADLYVCRHCYDQAVDYNLEVIPFQ